MRALELFAGAGGAALGLEAAGFEHAALCEWDPHACATVRAAGLGPVVEGDVRDLDAIEAVAGPGPIDLLWSSFPCQAFSTAGKRKGASDELGDDLIDDLIDETVAEGFDPNGTWTKFDGEWCARIPVDDGVDVPPGALLTLTRKSGATAKVRAGETLRRFRNTAGSWFPFVAIIRVVKED